ncbi:MAG TPA: class I SAM-dependent methyltransferase [Azospirillum sp.]|nr:class I SAM-dependent methyltransferase [Azospirillum sp.]
MTGSQKMHSVLMEIGFDDADLRVLEIAREERCDIFQDGPHRGFHGYGNAWWSNLDCPYAYKYLSIDSLYPAQYFGPGVGHPDDAAAAELYAYMQSTYATLFGREFHSILELGTGGGEITRQFAAHEIDYVAVEGTEAGVAALLANGIDERRIVRSNLKFLPPLGRMFDIAMCTEVAEHVEPFFASKVVDNCIRHAEVVWFSAADRNRRAHYHHMNEIHIEAWDNLFAHMGFPYLVPLNGLHERASRLYLSDRVGTAFKRQITEWQASGG